MRRAAEWIAQGNATNALATATKAGIANRKHTVQGVSASYSAAQIGLLQLKRNGVVIWQRYIHNAADINFDDGLREDLGNPGDPVSAELAAGAAAVVGQVELWGSTEG
jgi:hypothetical protein